MITNLLRWTFKIQYPSKLTWWGDFFNIFTTVVVYWLSSRAFVPSSNPDMWPKNTSFFEFFVIGEVAFLIPLSLVNSSTAVIRQFFQSNSFEAFVISSPRPYKKLLTLMAIQPLRDFLKLIFMLLLMALLLKAHVEYVRLFYIVLIQLVFFPFFLFVGMVFGSFYIAYGRGLIALFQVNTVFVMLSGAYFPLGIWPDFVQKYFLISPYTLVMQATRLAYGQSHVLPAPSALLGAILLWTGLSAVVSFTFFRFSLKQVKSRGFSQRSHMI